ncbi:MAG: DNA repair protein RecN [Firmicutes bacterium]|nr:DNA repair protein RecN [Bacillota bacterium]
MLSKLIIQNVALITHTEIDFSERLNILSGETGAGKSIIVDSLLLLLGAKYDKTILRHGAESGSVEGIFDLDARIPDVLTAHGFDADETLIVNRRFFSSGRNEIRINNKLSTALILQKITSRLVDIYGQNEYQSLAHTSAHLKIVDYFLRAQLDAPLKKAAELYRGLTRIKAEIKQIGDAQERARTQDVLRFQLDEIKKANVSEGEEETLSDRRRMIASGEKIARELQDACRTLTSGEAAAGAQIAAAIGALKSLTGFSPRFESLHTRLYSAAVEIDDIAQTCQDELSALEFDADELEKIENRLDVIRSLKRKYGAYSEMQAFYTKTEELLNQIENGAYLYEKLHKEKQRLLDEIYLVSQELSDIRKRGAAELAQRIIAELGDLGMAGAVFNIVFNNFPDKADIEKFFTASGADHPEFYFSANVGQPALPLIKIISGGELSRFMLALKTVSSAGDDIPTMIFDEIDQGVSGKIGQAVAQKLAVISARHQVLCVTHLPQIAAMADHHYYIEKSLVKGSTVTGVRLLNQQDEIEEISRLSGAKDISAQAYENARQMKKWSSDFKKKLK